MPAVTVCWKPSGLPIAIATWPTRTCDESPKRMKDRSPAVTWTTARSESGSSPTTRAAAVRPSGSVTSIAVAPLTT